MKIKNIFIALSLVFFSACSEDFLDVLPGDKITSANFPENENDIKFLLNGCYSQLRETSSGSIWEPNLFGFGMWDGATPNTFNWGNTAISKIGTGQLTSAEGGALINRWRTSYGIISRANYLLEAIEAVELKPEVKSVLKGEAHFLRGLAYSILVDSYGGVPIIIGVLNSEEAKNISRSSKEETWKQAISDYDVAINSLPVNSSEKGRANKGAALGMKMRAYLYQNNYSKVLEVVKEIEALNKYALFPSYDGLFEIQNENNVEVLFDVQYIRGENSQGSMHDQFSGIGTGSFTRGSRYVPTQNLIDAYERIDGSQVSYSNFPVNLNNPYDGWDPRMKSTVVVPGSFFLGFRFPNYLYPGGAYNHPGCRLKQYSSRKYHIETNLPTVGQSDLNYIVIRYADVILAKAEAIIELNGNINEAITLINRIRTGRDDVKLKPIPLGLSQGEARVKLRHERRMEFALEGLYWSDIKRWDIGKDLYPLVVRDEKGGIIETRFPSGYLKHYNLLPIPDSEISLNNKLTQNPGW